MKAPPSSNLVSRSAFKKFLLLHIELQGGRTRNLRICVWKSPPTLMKALTFTPGISRETSHGIFAGMYILVKKNLGQLIIAICLVYIHIYIYIPLFDIQYSLIETMVYRQIETLFWSWTHTMSCFRCN